MTEGRVSQDPPWGASEDSPMDEGSEQTAVGEGRRGERRAASGRSDEDQDPERSDLGPTEPTPVRQAGPGGPPDPAPPRRAFPGSGTGDVMESPDDLDTH